jgi:hypothetical protein
MSKKIKSKLFTPSHKHGNAVLNFMNNSKREFAAYGSAFHKAGQQLAKEMISRGGYSDLEACPIVFMYRHALELYLKGIIMYGIDIMAVKGKPIEKIMQEFNTHNLSNLLPAIKKIFKEVDWVWKTDVEGIRSFEELALFIKDLEKVDSSSFTFRYPVDKKGKPAVPHHFIFNVPDFCNKMEKLLNFLDGGNEGLNVLRDNILEAAYIKQEEEKEL